MYKFDSETKLYLVTGFTDFRCGIDALTRKLKLLEANNVLQNTAYIFMCKTEWMALDNDIFFHSFSIWLI